MKNRDFVVILVVLGVVFFLAYKLIPIFILSNPGNVDYALRNDFCEGDDDCVVINMDCSNCRCDMDVVNREYAEYKESECGERDICKLACEIIGEVRCVDNGCVVE